MVDAVFWWTGLSLWVTGGALGVLAMVIFLLSPLLNYVWRYLGAEGRLLTLQITRQAIRERKSRKAKTNGSSNDQ